MKRELRRRHFNFILQLSAQLEVFCQMGFYHVYIIFIAKEKLGAQRWEALGWDGVVLQLLPARGLGEVRWLLSYSSLGASLAAPRALASVCLSYG